MSESGLRELVAKWRAIHYDEDACGYDQGTAQQAQDCADELEAALAAVPASGAATCKTCLGDGSVGQADEGTLAACPDCAARGAAEPTDPKCNCEEWGCTGNCPIHSFWGKAAAAASGAAERTCKYCGTAESKLPDVECVRPGQMHVLSASGAKEPSMLDESLDKMHEAENYVQASGAAERPTWESTHCPYCGMNMAEMPKGESGVKHLTGKCAASRAIEPPNCGCDEYPECTHMLYWYEGMKAGRAASRAYPILRCLERNAECGQCELRRGHAGKHLAGYILWPTSGAAEPPLPPACGGHVAAKIMSVENAAKRLGVSPRTMRAWLRQGKLRGERIDGLVFVSSDEISRLLELRRQHATKRGSR
jgi:excisionase family DNA binding protein